MQPRDYSKQKTIYEMKSIIERCFTECEKAGHIKVESVGHDVIDVVIEGSDKEKRYLVNSKEVASHISKTLIGELMEFEILRRLGPAFRSMRNVENDLEFLFKKQLHEASVGNLRIGEK